MKLVIEFDLEVNGYNLPGFNEDPASAMRVMMERASEFLREGNLVVVNNHVCTPMGQPIAKLVED